MKLVLATIIRQHQEFTNRHGQQPNVLLVPPNAELELNAMKIKPGGRVYGLLVLSCETVDAFTVALTLDQE